MYLSNRDIHWAIERGLLIVRPAPEETGQGYDLTSIDLHLDRVEEARVWDAEKLRRKGGVMGQAAPEVHLGSFSWPSFSEEYLIDPPEDVEKLVFRRGREIVVKPTGFFLWQTKEIVGTPRPEDNPHLICFVEGKSTRARTGLLVHLTAPTIHAGWQGNITLEIANLGPFHFVLREDDVIAQLTVATISSVPDPRLKSGESLTAGQRQVSGRTTPTSSRSRRTRRHEHG